MENRYSIEVKEINPMETAPVWDYYDGGVEVVCLFYKWFDEICPVFGYFDRSIMAWRDHFTGEEIESDTLIGWLPDYKCVGTN